MCSADINFVLNPNRISVNILASREFFPQNSVFYWGPFHAEKVPQIIAVQFLGKLFETLTKVQLDSFSVVVLIENFFSPLEMYLEYLDTDKMRRSVENLSEIFGVR